MRKKSYSRSRAAWPDFGSSMSAAGTAPIQYIAARLGATVTGLDISPAMLDAARRRADAAGVSVEWREGRAEALPFPAALFDVVIAVTVLCWVSDAAAAVREMARVLRPGGIVVIGELGRYSLWAFTRRVRGWFGDKFWREAHFWTMDELRRLVEWGGLEFRVPRGAVYYPPSRIIAKWLAPLDRLVSQMTATGAAFLCVRAEKPSSPGATREEFGKVPAHLSSWDSRGL